jgi:hypothetical protein
MARGIADFARGKLRSGFDETCRRIHSPPSRRRYYSAFRDYRNRAVFRRQRVVWYHCIWQFRLDPYSRTAQSEGQSEEREIRR